MRTAILRRVILVAVVGTSWPAFPRMGLPSHLAIAAAESSSSADEEPQLRPMKKGVGRAVTSTMDKIDNPWFVISQIVIPICIILFSLMYVRRHRARQNAQSPALSPNPQQAPESRNLSPETRDQDREQQS